MILDELTEGFSEEKKENESVEFSDEQLDQLNRVYNSAFNLLTTLADGRVPGECTVLEWDMNKIGPLVDCAVNILGEHGIRSYYPAHMENPDGSEEILDYECPVPPRTPFRYNGPFHHFKNDEEKVAFLQKYGLLGKSGKKRKPFVYKGFAVQEETSCEIVGYVDEHIFPDPPEKNTENKTDDNCPHVVNGWAELVILVNGELETIHSAYLREMQSSGFVRNKTEE